MYKLNCEGGPWDFDGACVYKMNENEKKELYDAKIIEMQRQAVASPHIS